jgi:phage antirepressor YoqD-like protein
MEYLRYKDVFTDENAPSTYYANKDYFTVTAYVIRHDSGRKYQIAVTRVTTKGQDFLYRYLKKNIEEYSKFDKGFKKRTEVSANA